MNLPAIVLERSLFMESLLAGVDSSAEAEPVLVLPTGGLGAACAATCSMYSGRLSSSPSSSPANITPDFVMELIIFASLSASNLQTLNLLL